MSEPLKNDLDDEISPSDGNNKVDKNAPNGGLLQPHSNARPGSSSGKVLSSSMRSFSESVSPHLQRASTQMGKTGSEIKQGIGAAAQTTTEVLKKAGEVTIGKENVSRVESSITKVGKDASVRLSSLSSIANTVVQTEKLTHTFHAANELGNGAVARAFKHAEIDALALRLLRGHCVYSKSYSSDLWLHLKNKQIFLSLFMVHPHHPFNRRERISALVVSCLLAWGMEFFFCVFWISCDDHPQLNFVELFIRVLLLKIVISATLNGLYDAVLEQAMTCACVQEGCPTIVKNFCEMLSLVQLLIQFVGGLIVLIVGVMLLSNELTWFADGRSSGYDDPMFWKFVGITIRELLIGKCVGLFVVTLLIECLGFHFGRKSQMKPLTSKPEEREKWDTPGKGCCGSVKPPPNLLWNRFIGEDLEFDDLPEVAPTYDVDVYCCGKIVYSERADEPSTIPKWFRPKHLKKNSRFNKNSSSKVAPLPIEQSSDSIENGQQEQSDSDPELAGQQPQRRSSAPQKFKVTEADDFFLSGVVVDEQPV